MSQGPIEIAKAWISAYNAKDWNALNDVSAPDIVYDEVGTQRVIRGRSDYLSASKGWASAFPDSAATFGGSQASGDTAVLEVTWRGTHTGSLQTPTGSVPATHKPIEIRACLVVAVAEGKVQTARHYFDMVTMLTQLGQTAGV